MGYKLTMTGFKKGSSLSVALQLGDNLINLAFAPVDDINDVAAALLAELQAIDGAVAQVTEQVAAATIIEDIIVSNIVDDAAAMVTAVAQDGTEIFTILNEATAAVPLAPTEGISSAHGRLMAWTNLNKFLWSSRTDHADFEPSLKTQANIITIEAVQGKIIFVGEANDGCVIYSTGGIVSGRYVRESRFVFDFKEISSHGVTDPRHIVEGADKHYAWTANGLLEIDRTSYQTKFINDVLTHWLASYKFPIKLDMLSNRYLMVNLQNKQPSIDLHKSRQEGYDPYLNAANPIDVVRPTGAATLSPIALGSSLYPIYEMALVLDTMSSKWGIAEVDNLSYFSFMPMNQDGYKAVQSVDLIGKDRGDLGIGIGCVLPDGQVSICNDSPDDSWIVAGRYNMSRSGTTMLTKVEADFVDYPKAKIVVEPSIDGRSIADEFIDESAADSTLARTDLYLTRVAKWFNIIVTGRFHIKSIGVEGQKHGRN